MPQVTHHRRGEMLRALFATLAQHPDGVPAAAAMATVAKQVKPTSYEEGNYSSGVRRYEWIMRFATIPCVKAGWLVKEKGRWYVTDLGLAAMQKYQDPEAFTKAAIALYRVWKRNQSEEPIDADEPETDEQSASITYDAAGDQAWAAIEQHIAGMLPYDFQDLVGHLLRAMDYHVAWTAPPGKDGGIDLIAFNDPLGTRPPRIKVQVKRQQARVSVDGLRSFMALLGADDVGIFVNTGGFTKDAEDEARTQQTRRVTLIDLEKLVDLWTQHDAKLDQKARRLLALQPIYFLAPQP